MVRPVRFSGECNTSLGNSINNYVCLKAALMVCGVSEAPVVVEGDDAIVAYPDDLDLELFISTLQSFGLILKYSIKDNVQFSGFC